MSQQTASFSATGFFPILRRVAALRARFSRLKVNASDEVSPSPTVYFLTPDYSPPAGGIRVIYRHVDILNQAGIRAFVLHQRTGFRCSWFDNSTQVTYRKNTKILRGDTLVIPEICVDIIDRLPPTISYAIFNQGVHLSWDRPSPNAANYYTSRNGLRGVITVSSHSQEMLHFAFGCDPFRIHVGIDPEFFYFADGRRKNRITYMPRRMPKDAQLVLDILRGRGVLADWDVVELDRMSQAEVAAQLRQSKIFLAFAYQEGFGLPAAEAMACGNYVVGYHGFGGQEFFRPEFSTPVSTGDAMRFAQAVEAAILNEKSHPGWCQERGREASAFVLSEYSLVREQQEVRDLYEKLLRE